MFWGSFRRARFIAVWLTFIRLFIASGLTWFWIGSSNSKMALRVKSKNVQYQKSWKDATRLEGRICVLLAYSHVKMSSAGSQLNCPAVCSLSQRIVTLASELEFNITEPSHRLVWILSSGGPV